LKFLKCCVLFLFLFPIFAQGQVGLYADFSTADLNLPHVDRMYGSTFGAYFDKGHLLFLHTGLDARGAILGSGSSDLDSGLVGPRVWVQLPAIPIKPYVEALIGGGHIEVGEGSSQTSATKFEYQFLGGLDMTILPRIDWRVIEFSYGQLSGLNSGFNPKTISTGIVLRLP